MSKVSIVKGPKRPDSAQVDAMVREAVNHIGGLSSIVDKDDKVLIKPNIVAAAGRGVTTDPRIVGSLIKMAWEAGAGEVVVAESSGYGCPTEKAFEASGIGEIAEALSAEIVNVDEDELVSLDVPNPMVLERVNVSKTFMESDVRINVPVMKTHDQMTVTLGMKNLKGIIPKWEKRHFHLAGLARAIVDLNKVAKAHLTIIDGIVGMEGLPTYGSTVEMGLIIAGRDVVAVDAVTAKVMGFDPLDVEYLRYAEREGLGSLSEHEVLGEPIERVMMKFEPSPTDIVPWPGVTIVEGSSCSACRGTIRSVFFDLEKLGIADKVKDLVIMVGPEAEVPEDLGSRPLIMGKCLDRLRGFGRYVLGCPPNNDKMIEAIAELCGINLPEKK